MFYQLMQHPPPNALAAPNALPTSRTTPSDVALSSSSLAVLGDLLLLLVDDLAHQPVDVAAVLGLGS